MFGLSQEEGDSACTHNIRFALAGDPKWFVSIPKSVEVNNGEGNASGHAERRHNPCFVPRHAPGMETRAMLLSWVYSVIDQPISSSLWINS